MRSIILDSLLLLSPDDIRRTTNNNDEGLSLYQRTLLLDYEREVAGYAIHCRLEELSSWATRLDRREWVLPQALRLLPAFAQWEVLHKRSNILILKGLSSLRIDDISWLVESLMTIKQVTDIRQFVIEPTTFPLLLWNALLSRAPQEMTFSIMNTAAERYTSRTVQEVERLIRYHPTLRWCIHLDSLTHSLEMLAANSSGDGMVRLSQDIRRLRDSISGVYSPLNTAQTAIAQNYEHDSGGEVRSIKRRITEIIGSRAPVIIGIPGSSLQPEPYSIEEVTALLHCIRNEAAKQHWLEVA